MGGDSAVRSLLEKMTECASGAYLRMLEKFVILYSFFSGPSSSFRKEKVQFTCLLWSCSLTYLIVLISGGCMRVL
jgi:hypothetical protein